MRYTFRWCVRSILPCKLNSTLSVILVPRILIQLTISTDIINKFNKRKMLVRQYAWVCIRSYCRSKNKILTITVHRQRKREWEKRRTDAATRLGFEKKSRWTRMLRFPVQKFECEYIEMLCFTGKSGQLSVLFSQNQNRKSKMGNKL